MLLFCCECVIIKKKKTVKEVKLLKKLEAEEQKLIFQWAQLASCKYPDLELLLAIPNGGYRHPAEGRNLKLQGVKAGVPDIFLPVAKNYHHGLWIELKVGKNKTTSTQDKWIKGLREQNYRVEVCYGAEEAIKLIMEYLKEKG